MAKIHKKIRCEYFSRIFGAAGCSIRRSLDGSLTTSLDHPTVENAEESTPAVQMNSTERGNLSMEQVHAAWLAAGARGDVDTMRRLREQHPQWLGLQRVRT